MRRKRPNNFETITVSTSAIGITTGLISDMTAKAFITVEDANIRYRIDGTDPTSSVGHPVTSGNSITLDTEQEIRNFKAIRSGESDAKLQVTLWDYFN